MTANSMSWTTFRGQIRRLVVHGRQRRRQRASVAVGNRLHQYVVARCAAAVDLIPYARMPRSGRTTRPRSDGSACRMAQNISVLASGDWEMPNGTVLVKHFRIASQLVETRLFMRHPDGVWAGYTYQWNQAQTEATRVTGGRDGPGRRPDLDHPERSAVHAVPHAGGGLQSRSRDRATQWYARVPADGSHGEPDHDAQCDQRVVATGRRRSAGLCRPCRHQPQPERSRAQLPAHQLRELPPAAGADAGGTRPAPRHGRSPRPHACDVVPTAGDLGIANARIIAPETTPARCCSRAWRVATRIRCRRSRATSAMPPAKR